MTSLWEHSVVKGQRFRGDFVIPKNICPARVNDDPSPKDLAMAWMDVPFFLEALRGHESHVEFEGRALQSWDNLLRVPGRKGLLVSPSGHCWWVMLRFFVTNWEVFPVRGMDGVQMFGLRQQKCGKVKSQENSV